MPVRGPRKLYKIDDITVGEDASGIGGEAVYCKMKEPIGDFFNLQPLPWDASELLGTFEGTGANAGYTYVRRIGGFRHSSFKIVAKTSFLISEQIRQEDGSYNIAQRQFKTLSIGWPKGVSVHEFVYWIGGTNRAGEISQIVSPRGASFSFGPVTP